MSAQFILTLFRTGAILTALFLSACIIPVGAPQFSNVDLPSLNANKARVYIFRDKKLFGLGLKPTITINDTPFKKIKFSTVIFKDLPPGQYYISTTKTPEIASFINLKDGDNVYLEVMVEPGQFSKLDYSVREVEKEYALKRIQTLYFETDN